jgi:alpha-glucosidase
MAAALTLTSVLSHAADPVRVQSPDNRWTVQVDAGSGLALTLTGAQGTRLLHQQLELRLEGGKTLAGQSAPASVDRRSIDEVVRPVAPLKAATIQDRGNEAVLRFAEGYALTVRVYNDGFAYRFSTGLEGDITVAGETQRNSFAGDPLVYFGHEKDFYSHTEVSYDKKPLSQLPPQALASLPLLVRTANGGPALLFSETALESYPGQWIRVGADAKTLDGVWPALPTREEETSDRDIKVSERGNAIAKTSGKRSFPWRFVAIAATDAELLTNQLSYLLAEPSRIQDTAWIKPGKVQWDWWHDFNVYDVDFPAGVSQALYKHYIDFAAAHGARYIILDEGWYVLGDLTKNAGDIDVPGLVAYGRKKNVGVILWASWSTLKKQFDTVMPLFESWGVTGLKVDFFQRDDQPAVEFYWKLAADAAKRKLLLDFHGAHKPAGLQRTYPNVLTFEGVKGLENCKWSDHITPEHDTTLPFIRQVAGPMDYTPGAMDNAQKEQFRIISRRPMSQGTRCHQLALYVVYESPLQMYADSPTLYRREPESLRFMERVPVTWDETRVLAAEVGKIVALARRSGDDWFVGVLNGAEARTLELDLSRRGATVPMPHATAATFATGNRSAPSASCAWNSPLAAAGPAS